MPRYLAADRQGRPLAILVAESTTDADLFGLRRLPSYHRVEPIADDLEATADANLRESFEALGLSEASAASAARGRDNGGHTLPVIDVPHQEAAAAFGAPSLPAEPDPAAVQRTLAARARGNPPARSTTELRETTEGTSFPVELTEAFEDLGLSPDSARVAAEGR